MSTKTPISMYFMDWVPKPNTCHNDFYSNVNWIKMYDKIARGKAENLNEFEQEIAAEMIRRGYAIKKNSNILPAMPVYTTAQWKAMQELQKPIVDQIKELISQLHLSIESILKNHVHTHLKAQVKAISAMSLFNDGTYIPVSILHQNGYLSSDWTPNEIATAFAVLEG